MPRPPPSIWICGSSAEFAVGNARLSISTGGSNSDPSWRRATTRETEVVPSRNVWRKTTQPKSDTSWTLA
jgi:hypothetical protein